MNSDTTPTTKVIGLVMAAGLSRRFGFDKRLARLPDGQTLLNATLNLARRHFTDTRVVIRAQDQVENLGLPKNQPIIRAPEEDIGLGTSLGAAFNQLLNESTSARAAAVMLGDMPWIGNASIMALIQSSGKELIVRPQYEEQAGHPVIFGHTFWRELANLKGDQGAASVVKAHSQACHFLDLSDEQVLRDINKPEDLGVNKRT